MNGSDFGIRLALTPRSSFSSYAPLGKFCCSVAHLWPTLCNPKGCSMPGFPVLHSLGICSNSCPLNQWCHPTICCPLLLLSSIFPSIRVLSNELALCIGWPGYWSFSFSISPSNEYCTCFLSTNVEQKQYWHRVLGTITYVDTHKGLQIGHSTVNYCHMIISTQRDSTAWLELATNFTCF